MRPGFIAHIIRSFMLDFWYVMQTFEFEMNKNLLQFNVNKPLERAGVHTSHQMT